MKFIATKFEKKKNQFCVNYFGDISPLSPSLLAMIAYSAGNQRFKVYVQNYNNVWDNKAHS